MGDRLRLVAHHNREAPLEQNRQQVLLEVVDTSSAVERSGLDLVAVLDVSGSMGENGGVKLEKMKTAMKFVIGKLDSMDRLSIVTFSETARMLCPLQCMTSATKEKLIKEIVQLKAETSTNIKQGLETGLEVLARRRHRVGRVGSIILMSDGEQNEGGNAEDVHNIGDAAVYTFGFGEGNDPKLLAAIASKSRGGTFYFVEEGESLSAHFSRILAGLISVVVQDLKLTVWDQPSSSKIREVDACGYPTTPATVDDHGRSSVTVSFGYLYSGEARKVIVDLLLLPGVDRETTTILFAQCSYSVQGKYFRSPSSGDQYLRCNMRRTRTSWPPDVVVKPPELEAELLRRRYIRTLREASELKDLDHAKGKLKDAKKDLDDAEQSSGSSSSPIVIIISVLRIELNLLLRLTTWKEFISCVLAAWTSHYRQRVASRGSVKAVTMFETPLMHELSEQAIQFDKNPNMSLPPVKEDIKRIEKITSRERRPPPPVLKTPPDHDQPWTTRIRREPPSPRRDRRSSRWAWRAVLLLCSVLAVAVILAGAAVFAVFLLYKPKMPYLVVSDASLGQLQYDQDGTVAYLQASITILAENNNSKADASFSAVDLDLGFNGADLALLRAAPFLVPRRSSLPLRYNVESAGQKLDPDGMRAMDEALKAGVLPLDLFGKARTRWKVGVFVHLNFWTRISCRLRFFYPGNGTVMTADRQKCRSRSP